MAESLRILILEDNPVDAELIQFELQEAGFIFTSKVVMTKKDFVHELREFSPDLILSDYDLPQYNGALALAEAMIRCPDTPFILVTGAVSEDRAIEILTQGAKDYVLKTRLHQRLVPAVRRALAEAEEHKARKKAEAGLIEAYRTLEKQVEERTSELQESKERLNLALTSSRMGAFEWDITENKRYFDGNVHHLLGTNPEKFSGTAEEFFEVIHPDDQSAVQNALNKAIEQDTPYETEYRVIWPDESVHYIAARGKVQRDHAGRPLRILGVCWDVTERKRTEEALQESEERYRALIEQANDAIFVTEPAGPGKVLSANPAACRMFGYSADEFVGLDRQSHLDTSDPRLSEMLRHREGQGKAVAEVICRRKDGTTFPAEFATALFTDRIGGQRRSIAIVRDITERKQAEATLREAHEQAEWLARLPEENPNPVMRISADGSVLYCNPASVKIPGWACEIGRRLSDPLLPLFRQAMTGGQEIQQDIALGGRFYSVAIVPIPGEGYANVYGRDITKRKRVEETLQESENKFITAFRNSPVAMMISSAVDGRYVDVNNIFLKDTGYIRDEIIGHTSEELQIFADHHDRERLLFQVRKHGFVYGMEMHFLIKSGQILICLVSTSFIHIGGQPHLLSSIVDITDRKQAEAVLQTTLQRLHALVSSIQSCILFVGEGRIELANQAFCEYFELQDSPADLIGLTPRKLIDKIKNSYLHPDKEVTRIWEIVDRGQPVTGEEIAMQGGRTCLRDFIPICVDGKSYGRLWHHTDITKRKQAEEALRRSEEWYRTLFNTLIEGFCIIEVIFDTEGRPIDYRFLEINPAFERQTGLHQAQGKLMRSLAPDHEAHWFEFYGKIAVTGEPARFENEAKALNRWYEVSAFRVGGPESRKVAILFNDITERKQAEMELKEQTRQLKEANKDLESFSYSISHDLMAPLRAIDGFSRKLARKYGDKLDQDAALLINVIRSNTERMGDLIDDLLSFSRVISNSMNISEIDMDQLANEVWDDVRAANQERVFEVRITKILPGFGDRALIRQVLFNLFSNAVKFTKDRKPGIVEMSSYKESDKVVYCLKDNGVGFDMAYYNKLFGVFQRLHSHEEYEGTGVGLAIVQRIVHRHGGRAWAEGEVDKGATFYFTLPQS